MSSPFAYIPPAAGALNEEMANEGVADESTDPNIDSVEKDREASQEPAKEVELDGEV